MAHQQETAPYLREREWRAFLFFTQYRRGTIL
jgi:hypothetical protein